MDLAELEQRVEDDPGAPEFALLAEAYRRSGRLQDARRVAATGLAARPSDGAGRLVLGIALLDLGETAAAHYELERAISAVTGGYLDSWMPPRDGDETSGEHRMDASAEAREMERPYGAQRDAVADEELEQAFAEATPVVDEMVDVNRIAEAALVASELDEIESSEAGQIPDSDGVAARDVNAARDIDDPSEAGEDAFELERSGTFATETMARLLEEQGDTARAESIRSRLGGSGDAATDAAEAPSGVAAVPAEDAERARVTAKLELWLANLRRPSL
jgi:hypothetical protein